MSKSQPRNLLYVGGGHLGCEDISIFIAVQLFLDFYVFIIIIIPIFLHTDAEIVS